MPDPRESGPVFGAAAGAGRLPRFFQAAQAAGLLPGKFSGKVIKMQLQKQRIQPQRWRLWLLAVCEGFVLFSMVRALGAGSVSDGLLCLLVGAGAALPWAVERRTGWRMNGALFVFALFYLLATMAGRIYQLYYLTGCWDKLLHLCGGVAFALAGSYLPVLLHKKYKDDRLLRLLFGVLVSISIAALWEFYEYGMDHLFGMDMQRDTVITALHSYNLGDGTGVVGHIDPIQSVTVNGQAQEGYLDVGLTDTMGDMMVETLGALVYAAVFALDKGRHPAFTRLGKEAHHG